MNEGEREEGQERKREQLQGIKWGRMEMTGRRKEKGRKEGNHGKG